MIQRTRLAGLAAALVLGLAGPAGAQVFIGGYYGPAYRYGPPPAEIDEGIAPEDVPAIARHAGFRPIGRVIEGPTTYRILALDGDGRRVNVVVDADSGRIITVRPTRDAAPPRPVPVKPAQPKARSSAPAQVPAPKADTAPKPADAPLAPQKKPEQAPRPGGMKADESPAPARAEPPKAETPRPAPVQPAPSQPEPPKAETPKTEAAPPAPEKRSEETNPSASVRVVGPQTTFSPGKEEGEAKPALSEPEKK